MDSTPIYPPISKSIPPQAKQTKRLTSHPSYTAYKSHSVDTSHAPPQTHPRHPPPNSQKYPPGPGCVHNPADADNHTHEYVRLSLRLQYPPDYSRRPPHRLLRLHRPRSSVPVWLAAAVAGMETWRRRSRGWSRPRKPWRGLGILYPGLGGHGSR